MSLGRIKSALPRPFAPQTDNFSNKFWDALVAGQFLVTHCRSCNVLQFPPRPRCPFCLSADIQWQELSGRGTLYSRTRIHAAGGPFACMTPYSVGIVDMDEGVRILTRLMHNASSLPPGSVVELVVVDHTDGPLFAARAPDSPEVRREAT
jgi:uncharacterized OB-fold protein